jgi:hypothetical protein
MIDDIIEIENVIPKDYQDHLLNLMTSFDFPWAFNLNMVSGDQCFVGQENNLAGFNHFFYEKNEATSPYFQLIYPLILTLTSQTGVSFNRLIRMRANLTLPNKVSTLEHHMPHIDSFFPHWNAIYYVNDSDGDTVIFNETNDTYDAGQDDVLRIKENKFTIKKRITPKKGKVLIFPGKYYHSSSFAQDSKFRCVINMNLEKIIL